MAINVPFSNDAGGPFLLGENFRPRLRRWIQRHIIQEDTVRLRPLARQERRACGRANREARDRIHQPDAFPCQPVERRRPNVLIARESECLRPPLIRENNEDVRPLGRSTKNRRGEQPHAKGENLDTQALES